MYSSFNIQKGMNSIFAMGVLLSITWLADCHSVTKVYQIKEGIAAPLQTVAILNSGSVQDVRLVKIEPNPAHLKPNDLTCERGYGGSDCSYIMELPPGKYKFTFYDISTMGTKISSENVILEADLEAGHQYEVINSAKENDKRQPAIADITASTMKK